jgi:hypothetical protein
MKHVCRCSPFVVLLVCACAGAAQIQSLPVISAGSGTIFVQDTSVVVLRVEIKPETLNLGSKAPITASIDLASNPDAGNIDVSTVACAGATAISGVFADDKLIVKFNREDLVDVPAGEAVPLTVTGQFTDGRSFEGTDVIRVIAAPMPRGKM